MTESPVPTLGEPPAAYASSEASLSGDEDDDMLPDGAPSYSMHQSRLQ